MTSSRYVDTVPAPAPELVKKKKVIVLSYSRSGTLGLCKAMEFLGYKPYNMGQVIQNGYPHLKMFTEALSIKRTGQGRPYSRSDFDKWVWNYDVLTIVPCYLPEEIVQAYPDAKFILTVREPEAWAKSIWNTISLLNVRAHSFPSSVFKYFDLTDLQFSRLVSLIFETITRGHGRTEAGYQGAMKEYEEYNARAKGLVPADRLLVARLEDGFGWEEICPFLEVDIPTIPYPRINDTKQFQGNSTRAIQNGRRKALSLLGSLGALVIGFWYIRR
ncbi:P-loop containing nucleoside triphosphate hydrolase protein [Xylaria arbuscula]|nr:P-loop containing nucleoside triphosphate hydrolase protein [Xylaria arbuscula]